MTFSNQAPRMGMLASLLLVGCDDFGKHRFYAGDADTYTDTYTVTPTVGGPTLLDVIEMPGCDAGSWWYSAETVGWTNGENIVNAWDQGAAVGQRWNEEHDLPSVAFGPNGTWDALEQQLVPGAAAYVENTSTLYSCDVHGVPGTMVYAIRVYDVDGTLTDCAVFSNGYPQGVDQVLTGNTDDFNPITRPDEISAVNCENWD